MKPVDVDPSADLALLRCAAAALREVGFARRLQRIPLERIPLERLELELARVMRIELAHVLARAHALVTSHVAAQPESVRALQRDAAETIDVARQCGVPVPRVVRRLLAGDPATWPAPARLSRWAAALDPDAAALR